MVQNKTFFGKVKVLEPDFLPKSMARSFNLPIMGLSFQNVQEQSRPICVYIINEKENLLVSRKGDTLVAHFDVEGTIKLILEEKLFIQKKPVFYHLPFHYHKIPGQLRKIIGLALNKIDSLFSSPSGYIYPDWPVDQSIFFLRNLLHLTGKKDKHFLLPTLPRGKKCFLCLTHDIDSSDGYKRWESFLDLERKYGYRSTSNIPGFGYKVDFTQLREVQAQGFEIGIHGYDHSGKLAFLPAGEMKLRLWKSVSRFRNAGINVRGYRAPSYLRTPELMRVVGKYFDYDSSTPDTLKDLPRFFKEYEVIVVDDGSVDSTPSIADF